MSCLIALLFGILGFSSGYTVGAQPAESRIKIVIIDTGIDLGKQPELAPFLCSTGHQDFTSSPDGVTDHHGHGTNVAWLVTRNLSPKTHCVVILKYYDRSSDDQSARREILAFTAALALKPAYVNLSSGGEGAVRAEHDLILQLLASGAHITVAAGNNSNDLGQNCNYYPACIKTDSPNFYAVGNCFDGKYMHSSNYGGPVKQCRNGMLQGPPGLELSGTSQATAIFLNELIIKETVK